MPAPTTSAVWGEEQWANFVLQHLSTESVLLNAGARRVNVSGKSMTIPRLLDDGDATWTAEGAEISSDAPDADTLTLTPKKLANVVSLSNESVSDASVDELNEVGRAMTRAAAKRMDLTAFDAAAASATRPAGLFSAAYTLPGTAADPTTLDPLLTAVGTIRGEGAQGPIAIFMAAADILTISLLKEQTGSNVPLLSVNANGRYEVGGAELWPTPGVVAGTALAAHVQQIVVGVSKSAEVRFSPHAAFTADSTVARIITRVDWSINDASGLYKIT